MTLDIYSKDINSLNTVEKIVRVGRLAKEDYEVPYALALLNAFAEEVETQGFGDVTNVDNLVPLILKRVAEIDKTLSDFSNMVLHHPDFQKLEAAWRGIHKFMLQAEPSEDMQIFLMPVAKNELLRDLQGSVDFDQSGLFKKVYEEEYGTYGGNPFTFFIGDYYFDKSPKDITLLEGLAGVAAAAHTPFIAAASPALFDMDEFSDLPRPVDLKMVFSAAPYNRWHAFRAREDAKYISLVLPHVMQREPYGKGYIETEYFAFEEDVTGFDNKQYLWGNAAYAFGNNITRAFNDHKWCAAIRGVEGGGAITGLPNHVYTTPTGEKSIKCPTEVQITDRREKELSDLGFIVLCYKKNTDSGVFFDTPTTASIRTYKEPTANANAKVAVQLQYLLNTSRFAHYFKVMLRDKIGIFVNADSIRGYLQTWIDQYVILTDAASQETKAQYPLREVRVEVVEVPGSPGVFKAIVYMRPHFQLNEITVSLRLMAVLPAPAKS